MTAAGAQGAGAGELRPDDPRALGPYRIEARLGRGGQGTVFRAHDPRLGRIVALKVLGEMSPRGLARLEREARIASRVEHPAVCRPARRGPARRT